jgi:hypothetical protein
MRLNPSAFDAFLGENIGQNFLWRKAYRCPCFNPTSGAAKPTCPQCFGKGVIWDQAIQSAAGAAGQQVQRQWAQFGQWQNGDLVVTVPQVSPMYEAGEFDRATMQNATEYFSLPLTSGAPTERIHLQVLKFTRVFWFDVNGDIVNGTVFPTVGANGALTWPAGGPPNGTQYSINGTAYVEYFVYGNFPQNRNEHFGARLPKRIVLRRFDLFSRDLP